MGQPTRLKPPPMQQASQLLAKSNEIHQRIETCRDKATEAASFGASAAEREAQDRAAAAERTLTGAHEVARNAAEQAERTVSTLGEKLSSTQVELDATSSGDAQSLRAKARKAAEVIEEQLRGILSDAAEIALDTDPHSAERDAQALTQRVGTLSGLVAKATGFLNEAIDEARASAAEAEALDKIRAEGAAMVERADGEINRATEAAAEVETVVSEATTEATRSLALQTSTHIEAAEREQNQGGAPHARQRRVCGRRAGDPEHMS